MQKITNTENLKEKIQAIYDFDRNLKDAIQKESDAIKNFSTDSKTKVKRGSKEVEISNKEIMEEIRVTRSLDGEAGKTLKKIDKKTFDALENTSKVSADMHDYIKENFGFSFRHMSITDYLKLTESVIDYKLSELNNK